MRRLSFSPAWILLAPLVMALGLACGRFVDEPDDDGEAELEPKLAALPTGNGDYETTVWPLLEEACVSCHAEGSGKSTVFSATEPAVDGETRSAWRKVLRAMETTMPPEGEKLSGDQVGQVRRWFDDRFAEASLTGCDAKPKRLVAPMRKLTREEYRNSLAHVFGNTFADSIADDLALLPVSTNPSGYERSENGTSLVHVLSYRAIAMTVATKVSSDDALLKRRDICLAQQSAPSVECERASVARLASGLWRHVLSNEELDAQMLVYEQGKEFTAEGQDQWRAGLAHWLTVALQSPHFVFQREDTADDAEQAARRISFALTGEPPDRSMLSSLKDDPTGLAGEVDVLMTDERTRTHLKKFFTTWLLPKESVLNPVPKRFSGYMVIDQYVAAIVPELLAYIDYHVWQKRGGFRELMTSPETYYDERELDKIYLPKPSEGGDPMVKTMSMPAHRGLLGRVGLWFNGTETTNPIRRGVFVLNRMLCQEIPPPNLAIINSRPPVPAPKIGELRSTRTIFAEMTAADDCQVCHSKINPIGFALESYDGFGRFRDQELIFKGPRYLGRVTVDPSGKFPVDGSPIARPEDLAELLAESPEAQSCLLSNWIQFATGVREDACVVDDVRRVMLERESILEAMKYYLVEYADRHE